MSAINLVDETPVQGQVATEIVVAWNHFGLTGKINKVIIKQKRMDIR